MIRKLTYLSLFLLVIALVSCKSTGSLTTQVPNESKNANSGKDDTRLFFDANKQKLLGNYDEAAKLYQQCLEIDPNDAASVYELAKIKLIQNKIPEAMNLAKKAADLDPSNEYYLVYYANLLQSANKYDDAAKIFRQLIGLAPMNLDYYNNLAVIYMYAHKPDEAIKIYDDLENKIGVTEEFSVKKEKIYLQEKKVNKAIAEIQKLIDNYPDESNYYAILAEIYMNNGMEDKALPVYEKIAKIDPNNPYIHISLADYYKKKGQTDKAFEELKLGFANPNLDIDSKIKVLLNYYTVNEIYEGYKDQAFELAKILIKTHPNDPKAYSMYGDFLYQDKQYEAARDAFKKVNSMDSSKYLVWEQLLFSESQISDTNALLNDSKRAISMFPEQPIPYLFAGSAYYMRKKWQDCIAILEQGVDYVVDNTLLEAQFYAYIGDAYNQTGDDKKSDEAYEEVLTLDPDNDYVLNNYAYYLSLRNENLDKAAKMAKHATELKPNSSSNQDTYGWVLYKLGYYSEAKEWIEKANQNSGDSNAVILEHYGDVLWKLGEKEHANEYWIKAKQAGKGSDLLDKKVAEKQFFE